MAWSSKKLGSSKRLATKLENSENKTKNGDELQKPTSIVEGTSLKVTTNTQVATTLQVLLWKIIILF
jgi:hypothetical protein